MPALLTASAKRTAHELADHGYAHPAPPEPPRPTYGASRSVKRPKAV